MHGENNKRHSQKMLDKLQLLSLGFERHCRGISYTLEPYHNNLRPRPLHTNNSYSSLLSYWLSQRQADYKCIWPAKLLRQGPLPQNLGIPRLSSRAQVMDSRWILQHYPHARGKKRREKIPRTRQHKIPGANRTTQPVQHRKWKWHLHMDQQMIEKPTNSL